MIADVYRICTRFASIHLSFLSFSCFKILTDALEVSHFTSESSYAMSRICGERVSGLSVLYMLYGWYDKDTS
jgi:hypothetical protein